MKMKNHIENNYHVLVTLSCVHLPFMYAVSLIQEKWGLPIESKNHKEAYENYKIFWKYLKDKDPLSSLLFYSDVSELLKFMDYSQDWGFSFGIFIATNIIVPPDSVDKHHQISSLVYKQIKALYLSTQKDVQKEAKKKGLPFPKKGMVSIKSELRLANLVLGTKKVDELTTKKFEGIDIRLAGLIRQYKSRLKKSPYYVQLTPETRTKLDHLFKFPKVCDK